MREVRRTCVGCRRVTAPGELVRLVRSRNGDLTLGTDRPGRGAWVCRSGAKCFEAAVRRGAFGRALRGEVSARSVEDVRARLEMLPGWHLRRPGAVGG